MDQKVLVESDWQAGARLVAALEARGVEVRAALWLRSPELEEWRLVLATPLVDEVGPIEAYTRVQAILEATPKVHPISLDSISIVSPRDQMIKLLGKKFHTGPIMTRLELNQASVGNIFFDEARIYRMDLPETASRTPGGGASPKFRRKLPGTRLVPSASPPGGPAPKTG